MLKRINDALPGLVFGIVFYGIVVQLIGVDVYKRQVQNAVNAHDKVSQIKNMMQQQQYSDKDSQAKLKTYLEAAEQLSLIHI